MEGFDKLDLYVTIRNGSTVVKAQLRITGNTHKQYENVDDKKFNQSKIMK